MQDGILVVDKPRGLSSAGVVGRLKRWLGVKKIGHTGTLDPFATGVLLIAVGQATRISRFFLGGTKAYLAQVTLGMDTDTYDCTGSPVATIPPDTLSGISLEQIRETVSGFQGLQMQVAPAYSALKHNGVPMYKLAREGKAVEKPPRQIEIYDIAADNLRYSDAGYPVFDLSVSCSGGTYIRSLANDLGRKLSCGAHLSGLIRTRSSQFELSRALPLDALEEMPREEIGRNIQPISRCLEFLPELKADPETAKKIGYGQKIGSDDFRPHASDCPEDQETFLRITDSTGQILAIVQPGGPGQPYNYCCVFSV